MFNQLLFIFIYNLETFPGLLEVLLREACLPNPIRLYQRETNPTLLFTGYLEKTFPNLVITNFRILYHK